MKKTFFTSDPHFGDTRLNLFGRDILFKSFKEVDNYIIKRWNETIGKNDTVYLLGDVALTLNGLKNVAKLNGSKILIKGNYDEPATAKYNVSDAVLLEYFDSVMSNTTINIKDINGDDESAYLNHYPTNAKEEMFNIVGHIHGTWKIQRNMINVGLDAWHFTPVSEEQIAFQINGIRTHYDENVFAGELKANLKRKKK